MLSQDSVSVQLMQLVRNAPNGLQLQHNKAEKCPTLNNYAFELKKYSKNALVIIVLNKVYGCLLDLM